MYIKPSGEKQYAMCMCLGIPAHTLSFSGGLISNIHRDLGLEVGLLRGSSNFQKGNFCDRFRILLKYFNQMCSCRQTFRSMSSEKWDQMQTNEKGEAGRQPVPSNFPNMDGATVGIDANFIVRPAGRDGEPSPSR